MNSNLLRLALSTAAACLSEATTSRAQEAEAARVEVTGAPPGGLRQDMPVGPYNRAAARHPVV